MKFRLAFVAGVQIILPAFFIYNLFSYKLLSLAFLLQLLQTIFYVVYIYLAGRWDFLSYYVRYIMLGLLIVMCIFLPYKLWGPFHSITIQENGFSSIINVVIALIFLFFLIQAIKGRKVDENPLLCDFPLKKGRYYIAQGGNNKMLNHHYSVPAQKFALDIVALDSLGFRCKGFYPKKLNNYLIFGEPVFAPVDGTIVKVTDGLNDLSPPERDVTHIAGNHVVIHIHMNTYLIIAHLMKNSIVVKEGGKVLQGQMIGKVGNSGNTTEPHLHIHCVQTAEADYFGQGKGKPMVYGGKFLVRNDLLMET